MVMRIADGLGNLGECSGCAIARFRWKTQHAISIVRRRPAGPPLLQFVRQPKNAYMQPHWSLHDEMSCFDTYSTETRKTARIEQKE